jgi:hypothetical protein
MNVQKTRLHSILQNQIHMSSVLTRKYFQRGKLFN